MEKKDLVIGVDFGTDSVRAVVVDASDGRELASSVAYYPRWKDGLYCNKATNQFRQHPLDYIESIQAAITGCVEQIGAEAASKVRAISVDTTGSTPVLVDEEGTPLALKNGFEKNSNAMFILWKDHTAVAESAEINAHAKKFEINYLKYVGGIYSSEWFWSKLLHLLRTDKEVAAAGYSFVEHCDWIPFLLTGGTDVRKMKRSICAAGHKALYAAEFGGLPPNDFFKTLDPLLDGYTSRLFKNTYPASEAAGHLSEEWANRLGLSTDVMVGVGAFDAHMGAVGGEIKPYYLSKVMGTSTCDILVAPETEMQGKLVKGIAGQVHGSVIPGMVGLEAGQSSFGDAYAWFKNVLMWPVKEIINKDDQIDDETKEKLISEGEHSLIARLSEAAEKIEVTERSELALDWLNGRRTPDADQMLRGAFAGLDLGTDAPSMFRAVAEATCFGAKAIVDRFVEEGIPVKGLIGLGGVAKKSPFIMQMMADVLEMPIRIHKSEQTVAAGAAMFAATVAGLYPKVEDAMEAMGQGFEKEYVPNRSRIKIYKKRYKKYQFLGKSIEPLDHESYFN